MTTCSDFTIEAKLIVGLTPREGDMSKLHTDEMARKHTVIMKSIGSIFLKYNNRQDYFTATSAPQLRRYCQPSLYVLP